MRPARPPAGVHGGASGSSLQRRMPPLAWLLMLGIGLGAAIALLGGCEQQPVRFPHQAHLTTTTCGEPGGAECPTR